MRILGIDPGLNKTGWAIVEQKNNLQYIDSGFIKNKQDIQIYDKLSLIVQQVKNVMQTYKPNLLAMEETFVNNNAVSSLKLALVRGAIMAIAIENNIKIIEIKPNTIKKVITGNGKADKKQVDYMIRIILPKINPKTFDESDAIGIAIAGHYSKLT
jgi:crossover junction endodeoxyribonuclease RuvC